MFFVRVRAKMAVVKAAQVVRAVVVIRVMTVNVRDLVKVVRVAWRLR